MDPTPRIEGHLGVAVSVASGKVADVNVAAEMFRGYENIIKGHHPGDALHIMQRI